MDTLFGVVPAGGRGSRLAPHPGPKELFPIGWQPYAVNGEVHRRPKVVSQYVVESMVRAGNIRILMIVGEHKFDVLRYYASGERFGTSISYLYQEKPQGMVHAIDLAYPWIQGSRILFGMPDSIMHPTDVYCRLLEEHRARSADVTLGLFTTSKPEKFGMVELDSTGRVISHVDKPARTTLNLMWGCAVWESTFTDLIHQVLNSRKTSGGRSELVLGDVIDEALMRGMHIAGHHFSDGFYVDIGTCDELIEAQMKVSETYPR
jgi:glucose-1-phosphate thymidylyltransferase